MAKRKKRPQNVANQWKPETHWVEARDFVKFHSKMARRASLPLAKKTGHGLAQSDTGRMPRTRALAGRRITLFPIRGLAGRALCAFVRERRRRDYFAYLNSPRGRGSGRKAQRGKRTKAIRHGNRFTVFC